MPSARSGPRVSALRAAVARLFFAGIPTTTLDDATIALHAEMPFGGVVLFRHNGGEPAAMRRLTDAIHRLDPQLPPLVAIDHEGGRVHRLDPPFTRFPPPAVVAAHGAPAVRAVAAAMARELAAIGIDLTFAPVLDVASNPANPVIGDRAFATEPEAAAALALAAFRATRAAGLLTCGKHFPGHGDTAADSHLELPIVEKTRRELTRTELVPFRRAIAAGIPMLMSAHVLYPALDRDRPATLSPAILTGLLRRHLGFRGVVCTDDLEMRAIADHYGPGEAAVAAIAAGVDLLLYCHRQDDLRTAITAVERALAEGRLDERRIAASHRRVVALAHWRARHRRSVPLSSIGTRAHRHLDATLRADAQ
ncbi:MAG: beta-N-acetylhexosaminidase [Deltaproteobacteria bacterium]|nr:MAG: beta-N-acetylhexosaminidase [Deltaproteobacteria bacterium]